MTDLDHRMPAKSRRSIDRQMELYVGRKEAAMRADAERIGGARLKVAPAGKPPAWRVQERHSRSLERRRAAYHAKKKRNAGGDAWLLAKIAAKRAKATKGSKP